MNKVARILLIITIILFVINLTIFISRDVIKSNFAFYREDDITQVEQKAVRNSIENYYSLIETTDDMNKIYLNLVNVKTIEKNTYLKFYKNIKDKYTIDSNLKEIKRVGRYYTCKVDISLTDYEDDTKNYSFKDIEVIVDIDEINTSFAIMGDGLINKEVNV